MMSWHATRELEPVRPYIIMATRFMVTSRRHLPRIINATRALGNELPAADGLMGYSLGFFVRQGSLFTLSAWSTPEDLNLFVLSPAHKSIVTTTTPWMKDSTFARWSTQGRHLPPRWNDAIDRLDETGGRPSDVHRAGARRGVSY